MIRLGCAMLAAGAFLALAGCADEYGYYGDGSPYYYDGYYDNYYGPIVGGYWGPDAYFYYEPRGAHSYVRDEQHHFNRTGGTGFHQFHVRGPSDHGHPAPSSRTPQSSPPQWRKAPH